MGNVQRAAHLSESAALKPLGLDCTAEAIARRIEEGTFQNIVVLAGAGLSVSAGIPDFRSEGTGLFSKFREMGLPRPEDVFDIRYFPEHPEPFYELCKDMWPGNYQPTPSHYFIRLLHEKGLLLRCFTQNIDSLETLAGLPKSKVVAAHGNFDSASCIATKEPVPIEIAKAHLKKGDWKTLRDKYGGLVKPDIVFYGEALSESFRTRMDEDMPQADLLIVMGTSLKVAPFASLPNMVPDLCPRLLINRELVGQREAEELQGFRFNTHDNYRDVALLGDCDAGVRMICERLGWTGKLKKLMAERKGVPPLPHLTVKAHKIMKQSWALRPYRPIVVKEPPADDIPEEDIPDEEERLEVAVPEEEIAGEGDGNAMGG
eukprot:NODE_1876_length_1373_cov_23.436556_g1697_i0.p1 GENE.NODE_1876_length_1373_cov_23.436556_g1697_i0~~NODE_1876_length_1373_cov_23.436556_g1697_i0.p1  ORF type:complete len:403 (-),score=101.91 NODE_1876_length_1373_cov_23.436556_g1697_i0:164-1285(-)